MCRELNRTFIPGLLQGVVDRRVATSVEGDSFNVTVVVGVAGDRHIEILVAVHIDVLVAAGRGRRLEGASEFNQRRAKAFRSFSV